MPRSHNKLGEDKEQLQYRREEFYKYLKKNENPFYSLLFSVVGVESPWGQNTVVPSPCSACCGLDLIDLSALWGQDKVALHSRKKEGL